MTDPAASIAIPVSFKINGQTHEVTLAPWVTLLDFLREKIDLTGTKKGCDHGQCGACTVLIDGMRINSCLVLAVSRDGADITTIEGLSPEGKLHPLQAAFIEHDALQCGYCTPGQICSAAGLLAESHATTRADIREQMSGNLCRCGAYPLSTSPDERHATIIAAGRRSPRTRYSASSISSSMPGPKCTCRVAGALIRRTEKERTAFSVT